MPCKPSFFNGSRWPSQFDVLGVILSVFSRAVTTRKNSRDQADKDREDYKSGNSIFHDSILFNTGK
jgi:hypothetical protein